MVSHCLTNPDLSEVGTAKLELLLNNAKSTNYRFIHCQVKVRADLTMINVGLKRSLEVFAGGLNLESDSKYIIYVESSSYISEVFICESL